MRDHQLDDMAERMATLDRRRLWALWFLKYADALKSHEPPEHWRWFVSQDSIGRHILLAINEFAKTQEPMVYATIHYPSADEFYGESYGDKFAAIAVEMAACHVYDLIEQ